jgi:hypothetical protein
MSLLPGGPIEQKAVAGPFMTLIAGYLSGLAIEVIPWLKDNLTPDQQQNLPVVIAFLLSALAAYLAPHTSRPDLQAAEAVLGIEPPAAVAAAAVPTRKVTTADLPADQPHV